MIRGMYCILIVSRFELKFLRDLRIYRRSFTTIHVVRFRQSSILEFVYEEFKIPIRTHERQCDVFFGLLHQAYGLRVVNAILWFVAIYLLWSTHRQFVNA